MYDHHRYASTLDSTLTGGAGSESVYIVMNYKPSVMIFIIVEKCVVNKCNNLRKNNYGKQNTSITYWRKH